MRAPPASRRWTRLAAIGALSLFFASIALLLVTRWVRPPFTALMLIRSLQSVWAGDGIETKQTWVPIDRISPNLVAAVIASEDARFMDHHGVDWSALALAWRYNLRSTRGVRGASTITMQTAKNTLLWPGRHYIRKLLEIYLACAMDLIWGKRRVMEVYLNVIEWGPGIYGAEAASRRYFEKSASKLTAGEAALLSAVLPSPRRWSPDKPTSYIRRRAASIESRMEKAGGARRLLGRAS